MARPWRGAASSACAYYDHAVPPKAKDQPADLLQALVQIGVAGHKQALQPFRLHEAV
jgi:hypothetical protein